jgi:hypothetical protein
MDGLARRVTVILIALVGTVGAVGCGSSDDGGGSSGADAADTQTISFQEPEDPGPEPFTEPADVPGSADVELPADGPYGGSGSDKVCDRDKLIRFLKEHPDRMREWARVLDITPTYKAVSKYIAKLHPVTLTRDTQVTNHSFVNGRAVPFQAILQAGTAVLVDDYGRPVARCRCGNPLKEPVVQPTATCKGCPANYKPPRQCKLYTRRVNYRRESYTEDYYENEEYDEVFIEASGSGPFDDCYEAYPDPPVVRITRIYKPPAEPAVEPSQEPTAPPESGPNCENPRSQEEFELCHPPQEEPTPTETTPPEETPPGRDPNYECPDQPPAHPGEDYLRNCG